MSVLGNVVAAPHHVAFCDSDTKNLSHGATSRAMQHTSSPQANRGFAKDKAFGTMVAIINVTSAPAQSFRRPFGTFR
jgi:hypothetical protein